MPFLTGYAPENILIPAVARRAVHVDSSVSNLVFLHEQARDCNHNTFGCIEIVNTVQSLHISFTAESNVCTVLKSVLRGLISSEPPGVFSRTPCRLVLRIL